MSLPYFNMEFLPYHSLLLLLPLILLPALYFFIASKAKKNVNAEKPNFPPSPPKIPILGNFHQLGSHPHRSLHNLSQKYGPVMLLQLGRIPTLIINSAEAAKQILKTHDLEFCTRPDLVRPKRLTYNNLDIAFAPYGEYWKEVRKVSVHELLSMTRVQSFSAVREEEVADMIKSISATSSASAPIDLFEKSLSLSDKIISRIAFGKRAQKGEKYENGRLKEIIYEAMAALGYMRASNFFPEVGWILDRLSGAYWETEKSFHDFDKFFQQVIDEHLDPARQKAEHDDIIDVLLKLEKDNPSSTVHFSHDHIKAILTNLFIAGVDTSAVTINWAMAELIKNPKAMKKVQDEVRSYMGKSKDKVEEKDLDQFPYLKMVVKETLRLHPPAPFLLPRESMTYSKVGGYDVYPKTRVLINAWGIGRDPACWEKPDAFYPDRFVDSSFDFTGQQSFELVPFGGGRRGCPGVNMGLVTIELALANLLYCFNWELPNGMKNEDANMDEVAGTIAAHMKDPLYLVPIKV
ncbi:cytochrome P450 71A1-like [Papaver somniferum]|uniref:cytochrome P450 71A1-like n=1 Tax=Papaver somniferum TaxID=3469 RepID=UPI000E700906|nr:cytochrome P450 71A1-like [Papaver somniferum]